MDRQLQRGREQQAEPNPPVAAGGEKRARSLTRRPRIGVGRLSFSRPSAAATAAIPSSSSSSSSSPPHNSGGGTSAGSTAAKFSYGKPLTDLPSAPPNAPLPRPPADKKKSSTIASSSSSNSRSNSSNSSNNGGNTTISKNWLADTETQLRQDLETTKKELELIRTILWEIEMDDSSSSPPAPSSPSSSSGVGSPPPPVTSSPPAPTAEGKAAAAAAVGTQQQQKSQRKMLMAACREYAESRRQLLRERLRQVQFWAGSRAMGRRVPSTAPLDWGLADAEWTKWLGDQAAAAMQQRQQQSQQQKKEDSWMMIEGEAGAAWGPVAAYHCGVYVFFGGGIGREGERLGIGGRYR
ncbi:hypothetical protein PG989_012296 [Apiospora arundinis]